MKGLEMNGEFVGGRAFLASRIWGRIQNDDVPDPNQWYETK